jgi:hypothetical protein
MTSSTTVARIEQTNRFVKIIKTLRGAQAQLRRVQMRGARQLWCDVVLTQKVERRILEAQISCDGLGDTLNITG